MRHAMMVMGFAFAAWTAACSNNANNCDIVKNCGGSGGSGGNGGGGGGGWPPGCDPASPDYAPTASCGVFISPAGDDTTGDGSPANPYASFGKGVSNGSVVYACEGTYPGSVTISASVTIHGGLDCANGWVTKPGGRSVIEGSDGTAGLIITGGDVVASGIDLHAKAVAGVSVQNAAGLELTDSEVSIADQVDPPPPDPALVDPTLDGEAGLMGAMSNCDTAVLVGGVGGSRVCIDGVDMIDVSGGGGGNGTNSPMGGDGGDGFPAGATGQGGLGDAGGGCMSGGQGAVGADGAMGLGAAGIGSLAPSSFAPPAATSGTPGKPGQGGGGGGGAKECANPAFAGPSGGGGGSGGCGGQVGGGPGVAGPSAFGILVHGGNVSLTNVTITAGNGANGGDGQDGQPGGFGNAGGGFGALGACAGGQGGNGGRAGGGGGGIGGHSVAIGFTGTVPTQSNVMLTIGLAGLGGLAGNADLTPSAQGSSGVACRVFDFGGGTCVTP